MLGLTWAVAYGAIELSWPGSLSGGSGPAGPTSCELIYFSYVTMMTIGYGDIVPTSPLSRLLVVFEGFAGMTLTSVVLAVLVAKTLRAADEGRRGPGGAGAS